MTVCATRMKQLRFTIGALLFLLQLAVVSAHGQNQITRCGTFITTSGDYVLANNLTNCSGDAITIGGNANVALNLAGYQITGSANPQKAGIRIQSGARARIAGPGVISNYTAGFGIFLISGTGDVTGVTCTGNDVGFYVTNGTVTLHSNIAANNVDGFYVLASGELTDNLASGNSQDGIYAASRQRARFLHNTSAFNGRYGIAAGQYSTDKDIISNTALNNVAYDLFDGNSTCQNRWVDNIYGTSKGPCFH